MPNADDHRDVQGTDHGWGSYNFVFGKNLRRKVFGFNPRMNSSALSDIVPFHTDTYDPAKRTKGDLLMTTDTATWNSCILNALALPTLPRLGSCPPEMQLRDGLSQVPTFDERRYYASSSAASSAISPGGGNEVSSTPWLAGDSNVSHLSTPMTRSQILHFARRVGYSVKSLGLDKYFELAPAYLSEVFHTDFLKCGNMKGPMVVNPPLDSRRFSPDEPGKEPVRTSSMLNETAGGGAFIPFGGGVVNQLALNPWLEIDLGKPMKVHGFIMQARGADWCDTTCNSWVKSAKIQLGLEKGNETELAKTFMCNVMGTVTETIENRFDSPALARFVRILPVSCQVLEQTRARSLGLSFV